MPDPAKRAKYTGPERRTTTDKPYSGPERRIPFPVRSLYRITWEVNGSVQRAHVLAYSQADAISHLALDHVVAVTNVASPVEIYGIDEARPRPTKPAPVAPPAPKPTLVKPKYTGIERRKMHPAEFKYTGPERRAA